MGWLRKVGRKISKGLSKVFGSKLGAVIGTVGMFMLMGTITKAFTGWAGSAFGTAGTTVASDAAAAEAIAASGVMTPGAAGSLSEASLLAGENLSTQAVKNSAAAANQTVGAQIINASNNMDKANAAISAIDSASVAGSLNVSPTITDSLIQDAIPALEQNAAVVKANVAELTAGNIPTATPSSVPLPGTEVVSQQVPDSLFEKGVFDSGGNLVPEQGATFAQAASNPTKFARLQEGATFGEKVGRFTSDPLGMTVKGVKNLAGSAIEGVTSGEFVGDVAQGVFTGVAMNAIAGSPEEQFISGGVASQPIQEAAQANYIQEVGPSAMAASGLSRMPTFQELSQQTLYGTGSPNYLSQFYQPLATPQAIG